MRRASALSLVLLAGLAAPAAAVDGLAPKPGEAKRVADPNVGLDEKVGDQLPLDLRFTDATGKDVTIGDCLGGKPTILVLAYYRCPMNCTDVLNGLVEAMRAMPPDFSVGGQFNVLTVSFDPKEQPGLAREKKAFYVADYVRGSARPEDQAEAGWKFLTGKREPIKKLTDAVGFKYVYDKVYKEYDHPTGVVVLTPEGKVSRYFYGQKYDGEYRVPGGTTTLRLSLVEASDGKVGSLLDRLILRCYRFDHLERKYSLNILMAVRVGGRSTILALGAGAAYMTVRGRRKTVAAAAAGSTDGTSGTGDRPAEGVS